MLQTMTGYDTDLYPHPPYPIPYSPIPYTPPLHTLYPTPAYPIPYSPISYTPTHLTQGGNAGLSAMPEIVPSC